MIRIRLASIDDVPYLNTLIVEHKDTFYTQFDHYEPALLIQAIQAGQVLTFERDDKAVGYVQLFDKTETLWVRMIAVIAPNALLEIRRRELFEKLLDKVFYLADVRKIKCTIHERQKSTYKFLRNVLKFRQAGFNRNDTIFKGEIVGTYDFELHLAFWERERAKKANEAASASAEDSIPGESIDSVSSEGRPDSVSEGGSGQD